MELQCSVRGVESDTQLIFLHGLFGSHRNLLPIARAFEQHYQCWLPDLRNHGKSPHSDEMDYFVMSRDLQQLIQQHDLSKPVIIGHSMGGKVAMCHALEFPSQHPLVVLDIAPVRYEFDYASMIDTLLAINLDTLSNRAEADQQLQQHYQNKAFRDFLLQNLQREAGHFRWRANLPVLKSQLEALRSFPDWTGPSSDQACLFLAGQQSEYVQTRHHAAMHRLFPSHQLSLIPEAGHWLHAEQPARVIEQIQQFLAA